MAEKKNASKKTETKKVTKKENIKSVKTEAKKNTVKKVDSKKVSTKKPNKKVEIKEEVVVNAKKTKKENKFIKWLNSLTLEQITIFGIIFLAILLIILICVSTKNTKTSSGKDIVAKVKGETITADDLYKELKDKYGEKVTIDLIDNYLLNKEYKTTDDMEKTIDSTIKSYKSSYGDNYQSFLEYNGIADDAELKSLLLKNKKLTSLVEDYIKENLTKSEMKEYYETSIKGDISASHILISTEVKDDATDDEKTTIENNAKEKAENIIKELNDGADFAKLAKKYSDDKSTKENGGALGYFNSGTMVAEFEEAAYALELNKYTKEPVKTTYGYHIILKTGQKDKPSYKKSLDTIKEKLVAKKQEEDTTLSAKAIIALRKKYKLNIKDKKIKKDYEKDEKASLTTTTTAKNAE